MKKRFLGAIISTLSLVTSTLATTQPNIILIMADDMGYGDPSYRNQHVLQPDGSPHPDQGWIQTPHMDAMAAAGIQFERFYSASAVCSPTRASCLTGRNPYRVGIRYANSGSLGKDETPLSTILAAEGYATGHFGKWHLGTMTTLRTDSNRGKAGVTSLYSAPWHFDYDYCFATESKVPTYHPYRKTTNGLALPTQFTIDPVIGYTITDANFYGTHYWKMPTGDFDTAAEGTIATLEEVNSDPINADPAVGDGDDSKLITDEAINFIQNSVSEGKPFFVVLWYHTPHAPAVDPEGISGTNSNDAIKDCIEDMDTAIGDLRAALTTLGVKDDTMVWVTSDNGAESIANSPNEPNTNRAIVSGGLRERKRSFYEGGIRVPGILEWPNGITNSGRTTEFLSSTSDYYTTILDLLNISTPTQKALDGISLRPVIENTSESRTTPIGFLISSGTAKEAWIAQDYKLINATEWELYDMTLDDHLVETTPIATASNIASQPQAIQDIYNTMLADFTAWKATVDADSSYVSTSVPSATIASTTTNATEAFLATVTFDIAVTGLSIRDFSVTGGIIRALTGSGTSYEVEFLPNYTTDVTIQLPEGAAFAATGHTNTASNTLTVTIDNKLTAEVESSEINFENPAYQTVDVDNVSPANLSNNLTKFTGNPFTTSFYVRGSSSSTSRRVKAAMDVDLTGLSINAFDQAILHVHGYSLNNTNSVNLEAIGLDADWTTSLTHSIATFGTAADGGDLSTNLDSDLAKDYSIDITEIVRAWLDGSQTNHGLLLQLADENANNGLGIQTTGANAPRIEILSIPLVVKDTQIISQNQATNSESMAMVFQVAPNKDYYLLKKSDLNSNTWQNYQTQTSDSNFMTFYVPVNENTETKAFYSLSTEDPNAQ